MLVKSNFKGPLGVPIVQTFTEEELENPRLTSNVGPNKNFIFHPGWNRCPKEIWEQVLPQIQHLVDLDKLETLGKIDKASGERKGPELHEIGAKEQKMVIKGCFNIRDIKFWSTAENLEPDIRHIVQIQKEGIESGKKPEWNDDVDSRNYGD